MIDRRSLIAITALTAATPASAETTNYATPLGALDGVWEGALGPVRGQGVTPARLERVRLVILGERAQVFAYQEETLTEIKPGTFQIRREGTNAVISSIQRDEARPRNQGWVETWCFAVMLHDSTTLTANFVRTVNNNDMASTDPSAQFSQMAAGQLQRLDSDV